MNANLKFEIRRIVIFVMFLAFVVAGQNIWRINYGATHSGTIGGAWYYGTLTLAVLLIVAGICGLVALFIMHKQHTSRQQPSVSRIPRIDMSRR